MAEARSADSPPKADGRAGGETSRRGIFPRLYRPARGIKIDLYRDSEGDLPGEVQIHCGVGMFGAKGENFDGSKKAAAIRFVRELLDEFQRRPDEGREDAVG
jgi:hypothetical protein